MYGCLVLGVDNEAAIKKANNAGVAGRNKHFTDAIHHFREMLWFRAAGPGVAEGIGRKT